MEIVSIRAAVWDVVHIMRVLTVGQILRYFRSAAGRDELLRFIAQRIKDESFSCTGFAKPYLAFKAEELSEDEAVRVLSPLKVVFHQSKWARDGIASISRRFDAQDILTTAFWPIAELGCEVVKEILPVITINKSATVVFCTMDKQHYDLTWCFIPSDIKKAVSEWASNAWEQPINHVALVKTSEMGNDALAAGFDSYCILDSEFHPQYFSA